MSFFCFANWGISVDDVCFREGETAHCRYFTSISQGSNRPKSTLELDHKLDCGAGEQCVSLRIFICNVPV